MVRSKEKSTRELKAVRDTVESIWIAVVLAFVLRAFMVEAFVIPTGSMAPRLMGEHWQLVCPTCGREYAYGVVKNIQDDPRFSRSRRTMPTGAICPNCNSPFPATTHASYTRSGDRVLVMKYLYRFAEPSPWDVVVFRNPQNNRENYIKRLVGLPGETIEIIHGDIFVRTDEAPWHIRRKPPSAQQAMWQVVFDNDYQPSMETFRRYDRAGRTPPHWKAASDAWDLAGSYGRIFAFRGSPEPAEIVLQAGREEFLPHYGYNQRGAETRAINEGRDICSDLKLSAVLVPGGSDLRLMLSLTSFEHKFMGEIAADGACRLLYDPPGDGKDNWIEWASGSVGALQAGRSYRVALSHVDFRVTLWVDGRALLVSNDRQYRADRRQLESRLAASTRRPIPTPQVKIAARGGPCQLKHVKVERDVYYTSPLIRPVEEGPLWDFARRLRRKGKLTDRSPGWGTTGNPITLGKFKDASLDQFFVLGDNSPQSLDGRAWTSASPTLRLTDDDGREVYRLGTVPRYNLIGKAFFVYWPSGYRLPLLPGLPIVPNVGSMRLIR